MIAVAPETWAALQGPGRVALRTRVLWKIGSDAAAGVDLTKELVVSELSTIDRSMAPGIGGYQGAGFSLAAADPRRLFDPDGPDSYIPGGEESCLLTPVAVQTEVQRRDGSWEPIDVCTGYVTYCRWLDRRLELRAEALFNVLHDNAIPEDYAIRQRDAGNTKNLSDLMAEVLALGSRFSGSAVAVDSPIEDLVGLGGWALHGTFGRGSPLGGVLNDLARSCLGTLIDTEAGGLRVVSEHLPRVFGAAGDEVPFFFHEANCGETFERFGATSMTATEVLAAYGRAGAAAYRDETIEVRSGRVGRSFDLPAAPYAHQGGLAARLLQRALAFPRGYSFPAPPAGLLVQLNDRIFVRPWAGADIVRLRCVGKSWSPTGGITIAGVLAGRHDSEIYDLGVGLYGDASWGVGVAL